MSSEALYQPLLSESKSIRILDILPCDTFDAPVVSNLRIVSLEDTHLHYDALSWCWGDIGGQAGLLVNGIDFLCRANLQSALRHLRKRDSKLTIWVDAVCINQRDVSERNQQVGIMGAIYEQANKVHVWLGDADEQSDRGMQIFQKLQTGSRLLDLGSNGGPVTEAQLSSLVSLFRRPWWDRIWVMQEFALCKTRLIHCGHSSLIVRDIETIRSMVLDGVNDFSNHASDKLDHIQALTRNYFFDGIQRLQAFINQAKYLHKDYVASSGQQIIDTVIAASASKSTEPHDKIYGCLGVMPTFVPFLPVEYRLSKTELYTIATFALITHHLYWLYVFTFLAEEESPGKDVNATKLPSWACDFSQNLDKHVLLWRLFKATERDGIEWKVEIEYPRLYLTGAYFDEIVSCQATRTALRGKSVAGASWLRRSKIKFCYGEWRSFFGLDGWLMTNRAYVGGGSWEDACWRTLVCDMAFGKISFGSFERLSAAEVDSVRSWIHDPISETLFRTAPDYETHKVAEIHVQSALKVMQSKGDGCTYLFKTRRGYIGQSMGRRNIAVGDRLYFLDGGEVPWALRPTSTDSRDDNNRFRIRCECYVHGIMDGQGLKPSISRESKIWKRHEIRKAVFGGESLDTKLPIKDYGRVVLV